MTPVERARWRGCTRKRRYYSRRGAFIAAKSATSRTGKAHRVYRCLYGDHLHITKRKERS